MEVTFFVRSAKKCYNYHMGIAEEILDIFFSGYNESYKKLRQKIRGNYSYKNSDSEEASLRMTIYRLRSKGYIEKKGRGWIITRAGKDHIARNNRKKSISEESRKKERNLIVAFDIPEQYRQERRWLRNELVILNFTMLQKSVWFGPGPLPEELIDSLVDLKMLPFIKIFQAKESDIV